ncbi:MAG: DNA polymerase III subunit beta [Verrucomicrobiae bacterium]|nr:DNA polymerase III subunit beta [Verrucomicrobiae bacterium]MCX7722208.1 DNA polymerase III subunit beta [Verrucomicrobiae bacterium]
MKLTVQKEKITAGLQTVQNVVGARTSLPILANVLLRAGEGKLDLTATDLDITVHTGVGAEVRRPGAVTLPLKKLAAIVRELGQEIELEADERSICTISSLSSVYKLNGIPADEFPPKPQLGDGKKATIPQQALKRMLRQTSFAVSKDETRYVLNGVLFSFSGGHLTLVATDGRRLAHAQDDGELNGDAKGDFILPSKAVEELNRLLSNDGEVEIRFTENHAEFVLRRQEAHPSTLTSKLIEGNYPNYKQVIPTEAKERITLDREEFMHALRRAEIMTSEKSNSVKLTFSKNTLVITSNSPEYGEARESLAINYKGREFAIAFNPRYLIEPLSALDTDEIFFELTDELSPGVIKINGPFLYVVMPMRLA